MTRLTVMRHMSPEARNLGFQICWAFVDAYVAGYQGRSKYSGASNRDRILGVCFSIQRYHGGHYISVTYHEALSAQAKRWQWFSMAHGT